MIHHLLPFNLLTCGMLQVFPSVFAPVLTFLESVADIKFRIEEDTPPTYKKYQFYHYILNICALSN